MNKDLDGYSDRVNSSTSLVLLILVLRGLSRILSQGQTVRVSTDAALPQLKTVQVGAAIIAVCAPSSITYWCAIHNGDSVKETYMNEDKTVIIFLTSVSSFPESVHRVIS